MTVFLVALISLSMAGLFYLLCLFVASIVSDRTEEIDADYEEMNAIIRNTEN